MFIHLKTWGLVALFVYLSFLPRGCPKYESYEMAYEVTERLDGKVTFKFTGFTYDGTLEDRKKDMAEFYSGGYKEEAAPILKLMEESSIEFHDKTDTACTVIITGTFENFVRILAPDAQDEEFTFRKEEDRLTVILGYCKDAENKEDFEGFTFSLKYAGEIIEHNATEFDQQTNTLRWTCDKISPPGIYFVLEVE
ncbi:MAG: hypothetical protein ACE5HS_14475 [bacterium]